MPTYERAQDRAQERRVANYFTELYCRTYDTTVKIEKSKKFAPYDFTLTDVKTEDIIGHFEIKVRGIPFGKYGSFMLDEGKFNKLVQLAAGGGPPIYLLIEFADETAWMEINPATTIKRRGTSTRWDRPGEKIPVVYLSYEDFTPLP